MAIVNPLPAPTVTAAFATHVDAFIEPPMGATVRYVGNQPQIPAPADIRIGAALNTYSQQMFTLRLDDLVNNAGFSAAVPSGWRVYAANGAGRSVFGNVVQRLGPTPWRLVSISYGPRVWDGYLQAQSLGTLAQVEKDDYELRVVAIPGLNLEVFWLVSRGSGLEDWVVPSPASPNQLIEGLNTAPAYTASNFFAIIRPIAIQRSASPAYYGS
jgi:hypothetical protein